MEKKLVDEKTGHISYILPAKVLNIERGENTGNWDWNNVGEVGDDGNEVGKLIDIAWFSVRGEINSTQLSPGIEYEVFYVIKLEEQAKGWELPVTLDISTHVGSSWDPAKVKVHSSQQFSLLDQPRGQWIELSVGKFTVDADKEVDILFDIKETNVKQRKGGLLLRGAIIRPSVS